MLNKRIKSLLVAGLVILGMGFAKVDSFAAETLKSEITDIDFVEGEEQKVIELQQGYIAVTMKYKENSKQIETRTIKPIQEKFNTSPSKVLYPSPTKVPYPMEQKVKDNKYNINKYNNKKGYCNYEQRDYDKEGFDWNSLYANNTFTS